MSRARKAALLLLLGALASPARGLTPPGALLVERLRDAGLERVEPFAAPAPAARGFLPGEGELTVLLFAGCGPGEEASRDAALGAAADLARTPRRHTLELVLCAPGGAGPGAARRAASGWLDRHPGAPARDAVLAVLHLEIGETAAAGGVGLTLAGGDAAGRRLPPAWLAHAALAGARAGGDRLAIGDLRWPLMGQLLGRYARSRRSTGAEPFLAAGLPALTLAGAVPAPGWPPILAGIVRRLDALAGRPRDDDGYLALGGRIWTRRDLYWAGLAVWVALMAAGLPGRWRGAASGQRRRRGREYLPGFAFRMLYLVVLLIAPVATACLLTPAALLGLAPARRPGVVDLLRALAVAPALALLGSWALRLAAGEVDAWPAQPLAIALVAAAVALAVRRIGRPRDDSAAARAPADEVV